MTSLPGARRSAERFAVLVDGPGGPGPEGLLPGQHGLVQVVQVLRRAGDEDDSLPRGAFVADLRERLLSEAAEVLEAGTVTLRLPRRAGGRRERRMAVAAAVLVVLGGTTGIATAARSALPGEALYPVKRGIEHAQVRFSGSSTARARDLLAQAGDRLDETRDLVAAGGASTPRVPATLADFTAQSREGTALLLDAYRTSGDDDDVRSVRAFTARSLIELESVAGTAPTSAQQALGDAALALRDLDARAVTVCASCSDLPALAVPERFLASAEAGRALADLGGTAVGVGPLDNSHPVVIPRSAAAALARQAAAAGAAGQAGSPAGTGSRSSPAPAGTPGTGSGAVPLPSGAPAPPVPSAVPTALPGTGSGPGTGLPGGLTSGLASGVTGGLASGVTGGLASGVTGGLGNGLGDGQGDDGLGDGLQDGVSTLLPDPSGGLLP